MVEIAFFMNVEEKEKEKKHFAKKKVKVCLKVPYYPQKHNVEQTSNLFDLYFLLFSTLIQSAFKKKITCSIFTQKCADVVT